MSEAGARSKTGEANVEGRRVTGLVGGNQMQGVGAVSQRTAGDLVNPGSIELERSVVLNRREQADVVGA